MNYGLIIEEKDPTAYVLGGVGSLPKVVYQQNGQWDNYLPTYECQADNFETCACTVYGTQNCLEILLKRLYSKEYNFSERFNYILGNITCPGTDPHKTCENIRLNGLVDQELLPITQTLDEFITPNPLPVELIVKGLQLPFTIQHEWVIHGIDTNWKEKMKQALRYSPLGCAVYAWQPNNDLYIRPEGAQSNHWVVIYGYEDGQYWKCFDSYNNSIKKLEWDFNFSYVKRFFITERNLVNKNWLLDLIKRIGQFIKDICLI